MRIARKLFLLLAVLLFAAAGTAVAAEELDDEYAEYTGLIGRDMTVHARAKENSGAIGRAEEGTRVDVYAKGRSWTRIDCEGRQGYVNTKFIEMVQRKNPFNGPMKGVSHHIALGRALSGFSFLPKGYRYPIHVSAGALLSIRSVKDGRASFPYRREPELVEIPADKLEVTPFVSWESAKPGDLVYAFTTFYSMSPNKEGNQGRIYNIALAADRLSNIVIRTGESFSFNGICGPYTKENGYLAAPVLDGEMAMGYGGGVCQVCSTIYNIVLRIPSVVEDMNWHSQGGVSYLPAGFDATVSNTKDMIFRNLLPYDLRLEFEALDGVMTAMVYRN